MLSLPVSMRRIRSGWRSSAALCAALLLAPAAIAQPFVYVGNSTSGTVSVIDAADHSVVATIPVGPSPGDLAASADGAWVAVSLTGSGELKLIDTQSRSIVATVPVGGRPKPVAFSPDGKVLYHAGINSGVLSAIDARTFAPLGSVFAAEVPSDIVLSPAGDRLYLTTDGGGFFVIDAEDLEILTTFFLGFGEFDMALSPDGTTAYLAGVSEAYAIDTSTFEVTVILRNDFDVLYRGVAADSADRLVYVTLGNPDVVEVVDAETLSRIASIPTGRNPWSLALTPEEDRLFVALFSDDAVDVIDVATQTVVDRIPVGDLPTNVVIPPPLRLPPAIEVPTLNNMALVFLVFLLSGLGARRLRRA